MVVNIFHHFQYVWQHTLMFSTWTNLASLNEHYTSSFPGLLHLQFLITKMEGKDWGIFLHDTRHGCHISSRLISTVKVMYTRPILHSVLATKIGQAPTESYTERMTHTQATRHDSNGLTSDKCKMPSYDAIFPWSNKTALLGVSPLVSQLSLAPNLDIFYR